MDETGESYTNGKRTFTIPNGIKVIEVYGNVTNSDGFLGMRVTVSSNNKVWFDDSNTVGDESYSEFSGYVGVTPNKQYTIITNFNAISGGYPIIDSFYIRYSPEINNKTPTIYDY